MPDLHADLDETLEIAGRQLAIMIADIEQGRFPYDSLCANYGRDVKRVDLACNNPSRSMEIAQRAVAKHAKARTISTVMRVSLTDEGSGQEYEAFLVRITTPGGDDVALALGLPFELSGGRDYRRTEVLTFPRGLQLIEAALPAAYCGARLHAGVQRFLKLSDGGLKSTLPTELSIDFGERLWQHGSVPEARAIDLIGQAAFAVFGLIAEMDDAVIREEIHRWGDGVHEHLGDTRHLGKLTTALCNTSDLSELFDRAALRGQTFNLLLLGAAAVLLDEILGADAEAEKRALLDLAGSMAKGSVSLARPVGTEHRALADITAVLGLA
ncbi:MAG: hypothetical protein Q8P41_28230 [Pseudomonadota bacterium]|nr:hypothetical protein [Pseudomonadota bacterium]